MKRIVICTITTLLISIGITAYTQRSSINREKTLAISVVSQFPSDFETIADEIDEIVHEHVSAYIRTKQIRNLNVIDTGINIFSQKWDYLSVISVEMLKPNQTILCLKVYPRSRGISDLDKKVLESSAVPFATTVYASDNMLGLHYVATNPRNIIDEAENLADDLITIMRSLIANQ